MESPLLQISLLVLFSSPQVLGKYCEDGHFCAPPKECCREGCCYVYTPPEFHPHNPLSPYLYSFSFWNYWYFWFILLFLLVSCFGGCGFWRRRHALLSSSGHCHCLCRRTSSAEEDTPSEDDSAFCPPPQYSRCASFLAPPPYSEVASKPDLYPLVISGHELGNKFMVTGHSHFIRNYFMRTQTSSVTSSNAEMSTAGSSGSSVVPMLVHQHQMPGLASGSGSGSLGAGANSSSTCSSPTMPTNWSWVRPPLSASITIPSAGIASAHASASTNVPSSSCFWPAGSGDYFCSGGLIQSPASAGGGATGCRTTDGRGSSELSSVGPATPASPPMPTTPSSASMPTPNRPTSLMVTTPTQELRDLLHKVQQLTWELQPATSSPTNNQHHHCFHRRQDAEDQRSDVEDNEVEDDGKEELPLTERQKSSRMSRKGANKPLSRSATGSCGSVHQHHHHQSLSHKLRRCFHSVSLLRLQPSVLLANRLLNATSSSSSALPQGYAAVNTTEPATPAPRTRRKSSAGSRRKVWVANNFNSAPATPMEMTARELMEVTPSAEDGTQSVSSRDLRLSQDMTGSATESPKEPSLRAWRSRDSYTLLRNCVSEEV